MPKKTEGVKPQVRIEICDCPMLKCPHHACGREFQWDYYFNVEDGDEIECPHCKCTMYVEAVNTRIFVTLSTKEPT